MNDATLHVAGAGVYTVAGNTVDEVDRAIRAGTRFAKPSRLIGFDGSPMMAANILRREDGIDQGIARATLFAERTIRSCFEGKERPHTRKTALLVCFTNRGLERGWDGVCDVVAKQLARLYDVHIPRRFRRESETNSVRVFQDIACAHEMLVAADVEDVLLMGVHGGCTPQSIMLRDAVLPKGIEDIPGEGAAMVWLKRDGAGPRIAGFSFAKRGQTDGDKISGRRLGAAERAFATFDIMALLADPATSDKECFAAQKRAHELLDESDPACLATAMENTLSQWNGACRAIVETIVDLNGEAWRAKQWALASTRVFSSVNAAPGFLAPAMFLGELGCATLPLYLGLAAHAVRNDAGPRMVISSGPGDLRGAAIVVP